jgi:hypothetical protein
MRRNEESEFLSAYGGSLALVRLHYNCFNSHRTILYQEKPGLMPREPCWPLPSTITLAWACKKRLGQGLPVSIIMGKLLVKMAPN